MTSLYATISPHFTQDLLTPELKVGFHDEGGSWPFVAASLSQRLPLRCIEWKNHLGATKFIDRLPLNFVAQSELGGSTTLPLVCVYLVKCEDMEHYRSSVKARLAAWVERMNAAKVEWMVLYVPLGTRATGRGANSSHSVYKKIFDKIRADFAHKRPSMSAAGIMLGAGASLTGANSSSSSSSAGGGISGGGGGGGSSAFSASERICKIEILEGNSIAGAAPGQHQQHESQWSELLLRLRHCIMDAFQVKCYQYEEEVRVLDAKRNANAAGWDFGAFFLAKERLALMYQQTYLLDDAIRHLDELDAIFMNLSVGEKRSFQDESKLSFQDDDAIFTTAPLAVDLPAMQQQIARNRASARVIQLHCFCRQIRALYLMGSFPQLIQRATAFIASFFESLKQQSEASATLLEPHQPYQWAVGACLEIAYACELSWNGHDYQVSSASVPSHAAQTISPELMSRHLGDILYLARRILTAYSRMKNGSTASRLPLLPLSAQEKREMTRDNDGSLDDALTTSENPSAWYEWLQQMFAARDLGERFERCVWEMSHVASLHFSRAGRHRFAVFLGGECARYHFRHREFESASRLFRSHARQCEEDKWWNLVGDSVRNICSSELELGRAAEAVAACFSMLATTQEAQAEIGRDYLEKMMHTLVQSLDQKDSATKLRMGELVKPSVGIETMQTAGSDLDHGEVRVTLSATNCFPAGIHIETLRIRFSKRAAVSSSSDEDRKTGERATVKKRTSSISSTLTDLPRLHSLVLEDESVSADSASRAGTNDLDATPPDAAACSPQASENPNEASESELLAIGATQGELALVDIDIVTVCDEDEEQPQQTDGREPRSSGEDVDALVLEEHNVYLYEKASVTLVFLQSDLDVGNYVCSGVDCVLAGNTFNLLAGVETEHVAFEIPRRESTLRIAVDGPPLLPPQSAEQICVTISAQSDTVTDGVLEIACISPGGAEDECGLLQFLRAELEPSSTSTASIQQAGTECLDGGSEKLLLSIPAMSPGDTLVYRVWLHAGEPLADADLDLDLPSLSVSTVSASVRYQHVAHADTSIALRRAEAAFQILRPLDERVLLKRAGTRIFAAISLTCNSECGLLLRDYRLEGISSNGDADPSSAPASRLSVLQDPNARLRSTRLRPGETVHLAFVFKCASDLSLPDEARLFLDLQYDSSVCSGGVEAQASDAEHHVAAVPLCWQSAFLVRIPFDGVRGAHYRIDVEPKTRATVCRSQEELRVEAGGAYEFAAGEEIAFHVLVREFRGASTSQKLQSEAEDGDTTVLLCLDESSERDWILLGKQQERFQLRERESDDRSDQENDSSVARAFSTQKRLISTRVGRLRFPRFYLKVLDLQQERQLEMTAIPSERVLYPQSTMQVIVT